MKKVLSLVLALMLVLSALPALAEDKFEERLSFSATYVNRGNAEVDAVYKYFCDKFNLDAEMIPVAWAAMNDTNSVMIMGGTMYDMLIIPANYNNVLIYAQQGLIKPLPENWKELYPNIARAFEVGGVGDFFEVDGLTYAIPNLNFVNFVSRDYNLNMFATFYRADWAKELGYEWGSSAPISEFEAYLKDCVEKDMAGNGQTIGLSSAAATGIYTNLYNTSDKVGAFIKKGDEYVWAYGEDWQVDGIKAAKAAYEAGLIDPDFYAQDAFSAQNKLSAGLAAAGYNTGTVGNYSLILNAAEAAGIENPEQAIKPIMITNDDGVWRGDEVANFNWVHIFNPDMDDEVFHRLLLLEDYLYTKEAQLIINMGLPEVDWTVDEEGYYVSYLSEKGIGIREAYPSTWFWRDMTVFPDEFDLVNPAYSKAILDHVNAVYDFRFEQADAHGYRHLDPVIQFLSTESYQNYSVDTDSEIKRLVVDETISMDQVEEEWNKFVEANKGIWQPVLDDLNK